ncbi:Crp/Fnr family transcriptional regulator [Rhodobaculum claviforme]|uniref:Crp/Fnr family transcriptional regulator n=1 Tax=Rhodobaculum claviforme TaxID=1549854 RepID=A0A934WIZ0_9RHOB|nr:Crp/Fnr family transcriptional regulator [Rhodobaculum claviforme]MBK5928620.1 hypothetical protein [Rhodobaculum claviforme]
MRKEDAAKIVQEFGWLSRQPKQFQDDVLRRCHVSTCREGEVLYRAGDPAGGLYGLVDGVLQVEAAEGKVFAIRTRGAWFGETAAFRDQPRLMTMTTTTAVTFLMLPLAEFDRLIANAAYCRHFALLMAEHFAEVVAGAADLMERNSLVRVCGRLVALSLAQSTPDEDLRLTQARLGAMCGMTRATVNRVLGQLSRDGAIEVRYGHIHVRRRDVLLRHIQRLPD